MASPNANKASRIKQVEDRIVDVSEVDPYTRVLVFGPNKRGKTYFGATGPNTIVLDVNERGTKSVSHYKNVKVFQAANWADVVYFYWYLRAGKHEHETLCVDTITQMQHVCMKHVLKEAEDRDPYRDPHTPAQRDWLKMAELMKPQLLNFRNLPMNCVLLSQERATDNEDGETERVPDLSPSVRGTAMASVDVIGRVFTKEVRKVDKQKGKEVKAWAYFMLTGEHEKFPTGNRIGLPRVVRDPTMQLFIEANDRKRNNG